MLRCLLPLRACSIAHVVHLVNRDYLVSNPLGSQCAPGFRSGIAWLAWHLKYGGGVRQGMQEHLGLRDTCSSSSTSNAVQAFC